MGFYSRENLRRAREERLLASLAKTEIDRRSHMRIAEQFEKRAREMGEYVQPPLVPDERPA